MLKPIGLRLAIRATLYHARKDSFGCGCQKETCPKHLRLKLPDPDPLTQGWIRHIWRLEELKQVGCTWRINDLTWSEWQCLIWMEHERGWIEEKVREKRDSLTKQEKNKLDNPPSVEAFFAEGRKAAASKR